MALTIYMLSILARLSSLLVGVVSFSFVMLVAFIFRQYVASINTEREIKVVAIALLIAASINVFLPSKTEMYIIAGVSLAEKTINTPEVRDAANLIKEYIKVELDARIKDLKK